MKFNDILEFSNFYAEARTAKVPMKTAYKLSKLAARIDKEIAFYREKLNEIVQEFAQVDENGQIVYADNGNAIKLVPGKEEECNQRIVELQEIDVDIDITFTFDEFQTLELTPEQAAAIIPFIKE